MPKSKGLSTIDGQSVEIQYSESYASLGDVLEENRGISDEGFFSPSLEGLHDPFLMPDMEKAVDRILEAREKNERVVIFGDYDVDGVSSTAILFRYLKEIGIECSYRLPHRVRDGYGLKSYVFDELAEKHVKLVITVDCGTRDIEPIRHAKSLGIDVIVTDHHAVPDVIPEEVIAIVNPKRKDSKYPFPNLAGAGVAFKLLHGILLKIQNPENSLESTLLRYIDLASLGTVADCMPLIGENRIITALGLKQMKQSESSALKKYIENLDRDIDGDADVIGFQIGPRINAAGRMDSPLKALHWLLAEESRVDDWLLEVEGLNNRRQEAVKKFSEDALMSVDADAPILFYMHEDLEHGLIGLIAGKLTEAYGKPSIVLCPHHRNGRGETTDGGKDVIRREYEKEVLEDLLEKGGGTSETSDGGLEYSDILKSQSSVISLKGQLLSQGALQHFVASCRSPEWCHLVELLDLCKDYFVRYGGHRQAAGFTIEAEKYEDFQKVITEKFSQKYDLENLPKKTLKVECTLRSEDVSLDSLKVIDTFRPFGIGNPKPLFLMEDLTVGEVRTIGKDQNHLSLSFVELPDIKCLLWNFDDLFPAQDGKASIPTPGDILSPIFTIEKNVWKEKTSVQMMIKNFLA